MSKDRTDNAAPGRDPDLEAVERAWRELPAEEPPALLDQAVLNRARRELDAPRPRRLRWVGPFATAGVAVVALSVWLLLDGKPGAPGGDADLRLEPAAKQSLPAREKGEAMLMERAPSPAPPPAAEAAQARPAVPRSAAPAAADETLSPEAWIERLQALKAAGRDEELAAELAAFRAAWPDYPLPPGLDRD